MTEPTRPACVALGQFDSVEFRKKEVLEAELRASSHVEIQIQDEFNLMVGPVFRRAMATPEGIVKVPLTIDEESSWAPDGIHLAFDSNRVDGKFMQIHVVDTGNNSVILRTNSQANDITPSWSPDGERIAFVSDRTGTNQIYLMDVDGSNLRQLTREGLENIHPSWSPDGRAVLFSAKDTTGASPEAGIESYSIREIDIMKTKVRDIGALGGENTYPNYSSDGRRIVFRKMLGENNSEVFVMDSEGNNPRNLSNNPAFDGWPSWSPDGNKIVFASNRTGPYEVYVMNDDGGEVRVLTDLGSRATSPKWSPKGGRISFDYGISRQCHVLMVELDGQS
jgi:TolB protein